MIRSKIETLLKQEFHPTFLNVIDDSAKHAGHAGAKEGGHYQVEIAAAVFQDKKLLDVHRLIYTALHPVKNSIHALSIKVVNNV